MNIHCEFSSRFHSDSKRIRSGFESKRRESPRIHNVFAQQYGFANFGRVFTVIRCETLSHECWPSQFRPVAAVTAGRTYVDVRSIVLRPSHLDGYFIRGLQRIMATSFNTCYVAASGIAWFTERVSKLTRKRGKT